MTPTAAEAVTRTRISFFTTSLGGGGAEMHLLRVLNALDRERFAPTMALARPGGTYESQLSPEIPLHHLQDRRSRFGALQLLRSVRPLRRFIEAQHSQVVFSVMDQANISLILAARRARPRPAIVIGVQIPPSIEYGRENTANKRLLLHLIRRYYPLADRIVALSQGVADDLASLAPSTQARTEVIYNVGVDEKVRSGAQVPLDDGETRPNGPLLVACGRLTEQKGFPFLLEAMAQVRKVLPATLWIVGEGEQRALLESDIRRLGLQDAVRLVGFVHNPYQYMAAADVFVLSSLWEGFGNVIVEAMACGTPVVSTDCPYGPNEIIRSGENGLLVPPRNPAALAEAILRVLQDKQLHAQLAQRGKERAHNFEARAVTARYEELFQRVAAPSAALPAEAGGVLSASG